MKTATLFAAAESAWPEDEAHMTHATFVERMADAQDESDRVYFREALARDVAHMHRVFSTETDSAELIRRYDARLAQLMAAPVAAQVVPAVVAKLEPTAPTPHEVSELWHISRTALAGKSATRFDRMQYVQRELVKAFPHVSAKTIWNQLTAELANA